MATSTYTVVKGDSLWAIAAKKLGSGTKWTLIADLNNISRDKPTIYPGQTLNLPSSSATVIVKKNTTSKAKIDYFGLQAGTTTTVFAAWTWDKSNTKEYQVKWYYTTGDGIRFVGSSSTVTDKQSTYSAPANAKRVVFRVKPIAKTRKVNNKETAYWTASWSTDKIYDFSNNPPLKPPVPTVTIDKDLKLTAELSNLNVNASIIQFEVVKNNASVVKKDKVAVKTASASYSCTVIAGSEYKVRCRAYRDNMYSEWSDYSSNITTVPSAPSSITECRATSDTSIYIAWPAIKTATSYDVEYTTNKSYLESSNSEVKKQSVTDGQTSYTATGLETGKEYFFRVRATNDKGSSAWTAIVSSVIGTKSSAPTTWSSTTTVITGEPLTLNWIHNSEDGSTQTFAELEVYVNDEKLVTPTIDYPTDVAHATNTGTYTINTSEYSEGAKIRWRVATAGATKALGEWSVEREVEVYARPTVELVISSVDGTTGIEELNQFPLNIQATAGPSTQDPIGYHVAIVANDSYDTIDNKGNKQIISKGAEVYSKHFDVSSNPLKLTLSAGDVDLENNISYKIICTVSMNSGLTAEASAEFTVSWGDIEYEPNAEIGIDEDSYSAYVRPFCEDGDGNLIEDVTLSVYRREFDGSFTEIGKNIANSGNSFITDPHPSLDYARYRIVAISTITGAVSYCDVPGYPVGGKSVIIQWDEEWNNFDAPVEDSLELPPWSGSLLKLPYNIDISDKNDPDVELIKYIGRRNPVGYYGTQIGETSTWKLEILKDDKETLYGLRRLSVWMGNVYVREPSGSGYWANVKVSYDQTHCKVTVPVTIEVTRVEGGA